MKMVGCLTQSIRSLQAAPTFDLSYVEDQLVKREEYPPEVARSCVEKYRNFLTLCKTYGGSGLIPPKEADIAWHQHIINTTRYKKDCDDYFGSYLHHVPGFQASDKRARAKDLYERHFPKADFGAGLDCSSCEDFDIVPLRMENHLELAVAAGNGDY